MDKEHPYIVNTSEAEMDRQFEYWRQRDIERTAAEIAAQEKQEEENLYGAPARERYS